VGAPVQVGVGTPVTRLADLTGATETPAERGAPAALSAPPQVTPIEPGRWSWEVTASAAALGMSDTGVYPLTVTMALADGGSVGTEVAVPFRASPIRPAGIVVLWPVSLPPAPADPAPHLPSLLLAGRALDPDWVIDPALAESGESAQVQSALGGAGSTARLWALPYAAVDADPLVRTGSTVLVRQAGQGAAEALATLLDSPVSGTLALAVGGRLDRAAAAAYGRSGVQAVVLPATRVRPLTTADGAPVVQLPEEGVLALLYDPVLTELLGSARANEPASLWRLRERLGAVGLLAAAAGTTIILAPPPTWTPDAAVTTTLVSTLAASSTLTVTSLATVLDQAIAGDSPPAAVIRRPGVRAGLPPADARWQVIRRTDIAAGRLAASIVGQPRTRRVYREQLMRAGSAWWRTAPGTGTRIAEAVALEVATRSQSIRVLGSSDIVLTGRSGPVPVTLANDLDVAVRVGLSVQAVPAARVRVEPVATVTIPSGQKVSVAVPVTVVGTAPVTLTIAVTDPRGAPLGPGRPVTVRSAAYGRTAQVAAGLALAALSVFSLVGILSRVQRVRRGGARR